jgi:chromate transporter
MELLNLFGEFFRIGLVTYGGGLAILVFLQERAVELGWLTVHEFGDMIAIAQSTPGPIAINLATFVGFRQGGCIGALVSSLAVAIPGGALTVIASRFLEKFNEHKIVKAIMKGLRAVVIGLIITAIINISKVSIINIEAYKISKKLSSLIDIKAILLFSVMLLCVIKLKKHPIYYIIAAGIIGMIIW